MDGGQRGKRLGQRDDVKVPPDQRGHTEPNNDQGCALNEAFRPVRRQINHTATSRPSRSRQRGAAANPLYPSPACWKCKGDKRELPKGVRKRHGSILTVLVRRRVESC